MEDWQQDFVEMVEAVTVSVEQFFQDVGQAVEEVADQVQSEITAEIEEFFEEILFPPSVARHQLRERDFLADHLSDIDEEEFLLNPKVEPTSEIHPACVGCCHYHGRVYGRNLLVCAIHPYGWDDTNCPDWQGTE